MRERYDHRLLDNQRKAVQQRRMSKAHDSLMSTQKKNDRKKKMKKELSMQETTDNGATAYPKANLKRHSTIGQTPTYSPPVIVKNEDNTSKSTSTAKTDTTKKSSSKRIRECIRILYIHVGVRFLCNRNNKKCISIDMPLHKSTKKKAYMYVHIR